MNAATRLGGYLIVLAAVFAVAVGVGNAIGPVGPVGSVGAATDEHGSDHTTTEQTGEGGHEESASGDHGDSEAASTASDNNPGGLMVSEHGYTLDLDDVGLEAGDQVPLTFSIRDSDGRPVLDYTTTHDKDLHFIAVRRDMSGFQHVHPTRAPDGQWRTSLDLTSGSWRFFADFQPAEHGETMTLGADAAVAGDFEPVALPAPSRTARVADYTVTLDGELVPGESSELTLSVSRDGRPVTDLQPYLAAYGHLVALRAGDLGYLHVHPDGAPGDGRTEPGPRITFYAEVPSGGDYRLFLDFKHDGVVRTAEFTARSGAGDPPPSTSGDGSSDDGDSGHSH